MAVIERTHQSYVSKVTNSLGGVCIGLILFIASFPVLFLNEGKAVANDKATNFARANTIPIACTPLSTENEGKLVAAMGCNVTGQQVFTDAFGFSSNALQYTYAVEVYQWIETETQTKSSKKDSVGGGTTTVTVTDWTYAKGWKSDLINSAAFHTMATYPCSTQNNNQQCINPTSVSIPPTHGGPVIQTAPHVMIGAIEIPQNLVTQLATDQARMTLTPPGGLSVQGSTTLYKSCKLANNCPQTCTSNGAYSTPCVGDERIVYTANTATTGSFLAEQAGNTITAFQSPTTGSGLIGPYVQSGTVSASTFLDEKSASDTVFAYIIRAVGFAMSWLGLYMIGGPLTVAPDIVPCIGPMFSGMIGCVLCTLTFIMGAAFALVSTVPMIESSSNTRFISE